MKQGRTETIITRIISATFVTVAIAIFKPFGLDVGQWQSYVHLAAFWLIGFMICMMTDLILKYIVKMPRSYSKGAEYIIRRNLRFQLINTPLVALGICIYRHLVMSGQSWVSHAFPGMSPLSSNGVSNVFSLSNFLETLIVIAFCSFAIGLYWRFKFRSKYLEMELEETRLLNEKLKSLADGNTRAPSAPETEQQEPAPLQQEADGNENVNVADELTLTGTTNDTVTLRVCDLLYVESVGNYVKVCHLRNGEAHTDMLRTTSKQMEERLEAYRMIVRCHRAFLVNLNQVEQIVCHSGSTQLMMKGNHDAIPVSRSNLTQVKAAIKGL